MNKRFQSARILTLIVPLILAACGGMKTVPEVPVAKQWRDTITNFSMLAVYPMRERIYVGDVRLTVGMEAVERGLLPYRNLGHVDLSSALENYYANRPSYPTDSTVGTRQQGIPWTQPTATSSIYTTMGGTANTNRLSLAALPGVKVATVVQGTIGGQVPVGAFQIGAGAGARGARVLDISLNGIEEVEAPTDKVVNEAFKKFCKDNLKKDDVLLSLSQLIKPSDYKGSIPIFNPADLASATPHVGVISRVLYARSIDYTFQTEQGFAADIAAITGALTNLQSLSTSISGGGAPSPTQTTEGGTDNNAKAPTKASSAANSDKSVSDLQKELSSTVAAVRGTISAAPAPGLAASFVFADARGVTLREVFERPMAFAVQTLSYDVGPDGEVCSAKPTTPGPTVLFGTTPASPETR